MVRWIVNHDQSWLFVILYVGLAVVLSVWVSLFWLLFLAGAHFALEWVRHTLLRGEHGVTVPLNALWEVKLDLALVLAAVALALYMDVIFGVLGLQSAARAGAALRAGGKLAPRVAGWERLIRGFFLTLDDLANVGRAFVMRRKYEGSGSGVEVLGPAAVRSAAGAPMPPSAHEGAEPIPTGPSPRASLASDEPLPWEPGGIGPRPPLLWTRPWDRGDRFSVGLGVASLLLVLATPLLTHHSAATALAVMGEELRPFPHRN